MSKMSKLVLDIQERIEAGYYSDEIVTAITQEYRVSESFVRKAICDIIISENLDYAV